MFVDDSYMKDDVGEMSLHSSQDSLLQHDDSLSSMDIDFGPLNKVTITSLIFLFTLQIPKIMCYTASESLMFNLMVHMYVWLVPN